MKSKVISYLTILLNIIIKHYLNISDCLVYYHNDSQNVIQINQPIILIHDVKHLNLNQTYRCKTFLIQCDHVVATFASIEQIIKTKNTYGSNIYHNRKYIIIINNDNEFTSFYNSKLLTFVRDILVIFVPNQNNNQIPEMIRSYPHTFGKTITCIYELYTHKYIGEGGNNDPIHLDTWYALNSSFKFGKFLFPDKVSNQQGRQLRAPCARDSAFVTCKSVNNPPKGNNYNIILEYVKKFNFTLNVTARADKLGYIHWGNDSFGIVADIIRDNDSYIDIFYDGYVNMPLSDNLMTVSYIYEASVPLPRQKYGLFMLVQTFEIYIWLLTLLILIFIRSLVYFRNTFVQFHSTSTLCNYNIYGYMLNQASSLKTDITNSKLLKYILLLLLWFNVLLVTAYTSRLASVMIEPVYEKDIKTLDDLAASNLKLLFFHRYFNALERNPKETFVILRKKSERISNNTDYDLSKRLLDSREYAVARMRRITGEYYEADDHLEQMEGKYKPIKQELFMGYYYIILRQNSMHTEELTRLVATAIEVGLNQFWQADILRSFNETIFASRMQDNLEKEPGSILNLKHLKGIFFFWGCGLFISLLVFFKERYSNDKCQFNLSRIRVNE